MKDKKSHRQSLAGRSAEDTVIDLLISLWRIRKMLGASANERRTSEFVDRCFERLEKDGYEIRDQQGCFYDVGMVLKVVGAEVGTEWDRDTILETVSPTVLRRGNIVKVGEAIIGRAQPKEE